MNETLNRHARDLARAYELDDEPIENDDGSVTVGKYRLSVALERETGCTCGSPLVLAVVGRRPVRAHQIDCFIGIVRASLEDVGQVGQAAGS